MRDVSQADFAALFNAHFDSLLAYTRRRTPQLADAEDAMAETYVVAWRRFAQLPADTQRQRLWLFGVAYRVIANQRRAAGRRLQLTDRLKAALLPSPRPLALLADVTDAMATCPVTTASSGAAGSRSRTAIRSLRSGPRPDRPTLQA